MAGLLQLTVPLVAPTAGAVQLNPAGALTDSKIQPLATASSIVTAPGSGPLFVTATLKATLVPCDAVPGPVLLTLKSLLWAYAAGATSIAHVTTRRIVRMVGPRERACTRDSLRAQPVRNIYATASSSGTYLRPCDSATAL